MAQVTMRELLEAGVHFGHQTRRWNPKMRRFIFGERGGIYVIDLQKTVVLANEAQEMVRDIAASGGTVLFVGTKKQAREAIKTQAERSGMPYVNHRWLGGLLTNFRTITDRINRLHDLRRLLAEGQLELLPAKERLVRLHELDKLETNLSGVANMQKLPSAIFVIDLNAEQLAVREAKRLHIPLIGLVDTNCDPDEVDLAIPGNDDAIRSNDLIARVIADGVIEGQKHLPSAVEGLSSDEAAAVEEAVAEILATADAAEAVAELAVAEAIVAEAVAEAAVADPDVPVEVAAEAVAEAIVAEAVAEEAVVEAIVAEEIAEIVVEALEEAVAEAIEEAVEEAVVEEIVAEVVAEEAAKENPTA
ncbi:MAG: 30S ribosomal protein S2 [Gaiellales bacterium]|nr:30S ribosomal protein S2 [Gaiellales bacterium]